MWALQGSTRRGTALQSRGVALFVAAALAIGCRPDEVDRSDAADTEAATGTEAATDTEATGSSEEGWPQPEPPDLPPPLGEDEPGCYAGIRKVLVDAGPITPTALWSDGEERVVVGHGAVYRGTADEGETSENEYQLRDARFDSRGVLHVSTPDEVLRMVPGAHEVLFPAKHHRYSFSSFALVPPANLVVAGSYTEVNDCFSRDEPPEECSETVHFGALWHPPDPDHVQLDHPNTSVASHGPGDVLVAGPDHVTFMGEDGPMQIAGGAGRVWLDDAGGYFVLVGEELFRYEAGGDLVPVPLSVDGSKVIYEVKRDEVGVVRIVLLHEGTLRVTAVGLSDVELTLPSGRSAHGQPFSQGSDQDEIVVAGPFGAEVWSLGDPDEPVWRANVFPAGVGKRVRFALDDDGTGFAVGGDERIYHRDPDGRWSIAAQAPIEAKWVVPWGEGGVVIAENSAVYAWDGIDFTELTPELGDETIQDVVARGDELWVLARSTSWMEETTSTLHYQDGVWRRPSVPEGFGRFATTDDAPVVFLDSGPLDWVDGEWVRRPVDYWWPARRHVVASSGVIYAIIRFGPEAGVARYDPDTGHWNMEPVPLQDWTWAAVREDEVWVLGDRAAAHYDGRQWRVRAFPFNYRAGLRWLDDGLLVHERHRFVRIERCDED